MTVSDKEVEAAAKAFIGAIDPEEVYIGDDHSLASVMIDGRVDLSAAITAAIEAAASARADVPVVKPLKWRAARVSDKWERYEAETMFGTYEALEWSDGTYGVSIPVADGPAKEFRAQTIKAAKAAAQADYDARILSALAHPALPGGKFALGDRVTKVRGSSWTGRVVGFYSTTLTPIGYNIESENEPGSVQLYPETALVVPASPEQGGE